MADCTHPESCRKAAARSPSWRLPAAAASLLDFGVLRNLQGIIDLDPKVSHGTFELGMTEQELDSPQVLGSLVDQRRLGPSHAVRAIDRRIESDVGNPLMHDPSILARGDMR